MVAVALPLRREGLPEHPLPVIHAQQIRTEENPIVSIFSSRMSPEQLAAYKGVSQEANEIAKLAQKANGHGATRTEREKAKAALVEKVGPAEAKRQQDHAIKRHTR